MAHILAIFHQYSPYCAPLSASIPFCVTAYDMPFVRLLERFTHLDASILWSYRGRDMMATHLDHIVSHKSMQDSRTFRFSNGPTIDYRVPGYC
jgi:hypothetical protein